MWGGFLQRLVREDSVFEREHGAVELVEGELDRLGIARYAVAFDPAHLQSLPDANPPFSSVSGRRNVVARIPGTGGGRSILFNVHLDVVPAGADGWDLHPFSGAIVDGKLFGRGAYDDKAGVAIVLAILDRVRQAPLRGDLIAHFALEDETTGNGSLLCLDAGHVADGAIIVDGTRGERGINQHAGNLKFALHMRGKPASVSVSHMGENAAEKLMQAVFDLRTAIFVLNEGRTSPWTIYPSPNQFSTVGFRCDEATLTVPAQASAVCYATFTPPHDVALMRSLIETVAGEATVEWLFSAEPVRSESAGIEAAISRGAGRDVPFGPSTGTSDMRHFVRRGIPCVLFGPGIGYNPHRANEFFQLDSLDPMIETLHRAAIEWCS